MIAYASIRMRWCILATLALTGCASASPPRPTASAPEAVSTAGPSSPRPPQSAEQEATSLDGRALLRPELPAAVYASRYDPWAAAKAEVEASPADLQAHVWLGRRTAYLGRYVEAIDVYTRALERFPVEPHLLRHRGHRYLTVRDFKAAVLDLTAAARAVEDMPRRLIKRMPASYIPSAHGSPAWPRWVWPPSVPVLTRPGQPALLGSLSAHWVTV